MATLVHKKWGREGAWISTSSNSVYFFIIFFSQFSEEEYLGVLLIIHDFLSFCDCSDPSRLEMTSKACWALEKVRRSDSPAVSPINADFVLMKKKGFTTLAGENSN